MSEITEKDLLECFDGMCLFLANHGWTKRDERAVAIRELIQKVDLPEFLRGIATKQAEVDNLKKHIKNIEERCAELIQQKAELPEITEAWAQGKAKEIWSLIKDAQDEDLSDPALDLHYLGLSLDIVDSIINDLRPKNK